MQGYVVDQEMQEAVVIPQAGCGVRGGKVSSLHVGAARAVAAARVRAGGVRRRGREGEEGELHEWRVRGTASMPEKRGCPQIALFASPPARRSAWRWGQFARVAGVEGRGATMRSLASFLVRRSTAGPQA